jgi:vacuolar-type H+-ATPase subunit H
MSSVRIDGYPARESVNRALDETKNNIRRSTDEARKEIPRYTQAANDYQEQTIQAAREIADNYIESQKEIINSLQSAWLPHIEKANETFTSNWMSPRYLTEIYANMVSRSADNMIAATRLVNNMIFANMEVFKYSMQQAKDNARELSRIGVNSARTFEQTSRDTATATTRIGSGGDNTSTTSRVYIEREQ